MKFICLVLGAVLLSACSSDTLVKMSNKTGLVTFSYSPAKLIPKYEKNIEKLERVDKFIQCMDTEKDKTAANNESGIITELNALRDAAYSKPYNLKANIDRLAITLNSLKAARDVNQHKITEGALFNRIRDDQKVLKGIQKATPNVNGRFKALGKLLLTTQASSEATNCLKKYNEGV